MRVKATGTNGVEYALPCQHYGVGGNKKLLHKQKLYIF